MDVLLIWDIDGTLIQGRGIGRIAMDMAFLELYGIQEAFRNIDMAGMLDAVILKKAYAFHKVEGADPSHFFDRYCHYLAREVEKRESGFAAPGIPQILAYLGQVPDFHHALGTGNIAPAATIKLSKDDLWKYFPVGGYGEIERDRWQVITESMEKARDHYGISFLPKNTYVIGDTPRDIDCGKAAGVRTIGVATGFHSAGSLETCGADFVFPDLTDIQAFLHIFG